MGEICSPGIPLPLGSRFVTVKDMNTARYFPRLLGLAIWCVTLAIVSGCGQEPTGPPVVGPPKQVSLGDNISLDVQGDQRRVLVKASVCLREGPLEAFLTHKKQNQNKAHEAPLWADVDARKLHEALLLAKAVPGAPVQFDPDYAPPRGQTIKITLQYEEDGKQRTVPGQSWVRDREKQEAMSEEWVFAGSQLYADPTRPNALKRFMAQEEGTLVTISNFPSALIDVGAKSIKSSDRSLNDYECFTERIPPLKTPVTVILEPVGEYKKGQK
jgi:hypothetical protein